MSFKEGVSYKDRVGREYTYLYRTGGVLVFSIDGEKKARHVSGNYRWDDKETEMDILM